MPKIFCHMAKEYKVEQPRQSVNLPSGRGSAQFVDQRPTTQLQKDIHALVQRRVQAAGPLKTHQDSGADGLDSGPTTIERPTASLLAHHRPVLQARRIKPCGGTIGVSHEVVQRMPYNLPIAKEEKTKKKRRGRRTQLERDPDFRPRVRRFNITEKDAKEVMSMTAHKRRHVNKKRFKEVYTCPGCRRPLGFKDLNDKIHLTQFSYTSKQRKRKHTVRSLAMDHFPPWAGRLAKLERKGATDRMKQKDYQDPKRLRALCKKCNESHFFETRVMEDYTSDDDEKGFDAPPSEPHNLDEYTKFHYYPPPGGGGGITA